MQNIILQLFVAFMSVLFARWLDDVWPRTQLKEQLIKIHSEVKVAEKPKTLSEQINERIFQSKWTYYILTIMWLYCLLAFSGYYLLYRTQILHLPIQNSWMTGIIFEYTKGGVSLISLLVTFLVYPIVNFFTTRIFSLIIRLLVGMNLNFTNGNVQQIRMGTSMGLSITIAVFLALYLS